MKRLALFLVVLVTPALASADKAYNEGSTGGTWDCAKDASVAININNATFTFKGACTTISINGNGNKLSVEKAKLITGNGNNNTVDAAAVDEITVNGNNNTVSYAKAAKPKVTNNGNDNKIAAKAK